MSRRGVTLARQILMGPSPCDHCPAYDRCRDERLACDAFHAYTITGRRLSPHAQIAINGERVKVTGMGPIAPSRARYRQCFPKPRKKDRGW